MSNSTTVYVETLGCEKNRVDTEIMMGSLIEHDYMLEPEADKARVIVINTCGFITSAVNESIDRILALAGHKKTGVCETLIVVGCLVERYKNDLIREIPEIDAIVGASDYTDLPEMLTRLVKAGPVSPTFEKRVRYASENYGKPRVYSREEPYSYLKIAEGCSNQCSFCLIPKLRGQYTSKPVAYILDEFSAMLDSGIKEINLISQDCSSYGQDSDSAEDLTQLVRSILEHSRADFWLRLFYLYPNRFPLSVVELMNQDQRLTPYVDMPIQHISDRVLADMRRQITGLEIERLLDNICSLRGDIAIRTTLMVGFPGETADEFKELEDLVKKGYFTHVGVFEYSPEERTVAHRYHDSVSVEEKKERKERIMSAQQGVSLEKNQVMVGQKQKVLLEGVYEETELLLKGRNKFQGAEVDGVVLINEGTSDAGQFCQVEITDAHPYDLIGKII